MDEGTDKGKDISSGATGSSVAASAPLTVCTLDLVSPHSDLHAEGVWRPGEGGAVRAQLPVRLAHQEARRHPAQQAVVHQHGLAEGQGQGNRLGGGPELLGAGSVQRGSKEEEEEEEEAAWPFWVSASGSWGALSWSLGYIV